MAYDLNSILKSIGLGNNSSTGSFDLSSASSYAPNFSNPDVGSLDTSGFMSGGQLGSIGKTGGSSSGFLDNADGSTNFGGIAKLLAGLGGLYTGFTGNQQARRSLNFTKDAFNRQNAQNVKTYNNYLEDRARSRYAIEGRPQSEADAFIKKQSL
jgi:hypothetical protein